MWESNGQSKEYTPNELLEIIKKYKPYYGTNGGVTFSGGEPLMQASFLKELVKLCNQENINVALDTSGSVYNQEVEELIDDVDVILLDIKAINDSDYIKMTSGSINNFNKFLKLLEDKHKKIWLRIVIVPGINDNLDYIHNLASYIKGISNVERVELLSFHKLGDPKYEQLGINNPLKETKAMDIEKCKELESILKTLVK
jgi:pyruvate formate lyase activating enzyme